MEKGEETKTEAERRAGAGKLKLSYAVPVSGLVMGYFVRLENVLKTVIELWDTNKKPTVHFAIIASPTRLR